MITLVGVVFSVLFATAALVGPRVLVGVLAASLPFSHVAAIIVGDSAIGPFWLGGCFVAMRLLWVLWRKVGMRVPAGVLLQGSNTALFLFAGYAILITGIGGLVFAGIGVYAPRGGIDEQLGNLTPFSLTISSLAQIVYLILGVVTVLWFAFERPRIGRLFEIAICVGFALTLWHAALPGFWPTEIFDSNPSYRYMDWAGARERGPFAEPSMLALFLVASISYSASAFAQAQTRRRVYYGALILIGTYLVALSATGTAVVSVALLVVLAAALFVCRSIVSGHRVRLLWAGGALLALAALFGAFWGIIAPHTLGLVVEKLGSDSLTNRNASNVRAWEILWETWGLGLGLGSNRPSSLIFLLLSCTGVIGLLLFVRACLGYALVGLSRSTARPLAWAFIATLVAQAVAVPDLSVPQLWFLMGGVAITYVDWWRSTTVHARATRERWTALYRVRPEFAAFRESGLRLVGASRDN